MTIFKVEWDGICTGGLAFVWAPNEKKAKVEVLDMIYNNVKSEKYVKKAKASIEVVPLTTLPRTSEVLYFHDGDH